MTAPKSSTQPTTTSPTGLLPTASVNAASAGKPGTGSGYFNAVAGGHLYASQLAGHHDASYYENWNKERQEAVARGEDPNAKFLALVAQREARSKRGKLRKFFLGKKDGKKAHGSALSAEEEREALERDKVAKIGEDDDSRFVR